MEVYVLESTANSNEFITGMDDRVYPVALTTNLAQATLFDSEERAKEVAEINGWCARRLEMTLGELIYRPAVEGEKPIEIVGGRVSAKDIALKHLEEANPIGWNGKTPDVPEGFSTSPATYMVDSESFVEISFVQDQALGIWCHICKLITEHGKRVFAFANGDSVYDADLIAKTIMRVCGDRVKA